MNVMQEFSFSFGTKMFECGKKLNYAGGMAHDLLDFWNKDYPLNNLGLGCLVVCALAAFDLVGHDGNLVVSHAEGYLMANGADEVTTKTLIDLYTTCRSRVSSSHHCEAALKVAECFRSGIWQRSWVPDVSAIFSTRRVQCPDYSVY